MERNSVGASCLAQSSWGATEHGVVSECPGRCNDQIGVRIHSGGARSNCERKTTLASQQTGFAPQPSTLVCHAYSACDRRHSESLALARPCYAPKHGDLPQSRPYGEAGGHGVFGPAHQISCSPCFGPNRSARYAPSEASRMASFVGRHGTTPHIYGRRIFAVLWCTAKPEGD